MFETTRYETSRRLRGTAILTIGISVLCAFFVWYFTQLEGIDLDEMISELPPAMVDAFGITTLSTVEGFLAAEIYNFVWLLGLGLYFAYVAGGLVASDIERDRMDLLLAFPISRSRLLAEKFASLLVPIVTLNVVVGVVVYGLVLAIGESIDPIDLAMVHLLSIPYFLTCAGLGLVLSVIVSRGDVAKRIAIALVFVLFLVESIVASAGGFEWIQYISPTHYYNPTPVLVDGTYGFVDAGILLVASLGLVVVSQILFTRRDI